MAHKPTFLVAGAIAVASFAGLGAATAAAAEDSTDNDAQIEAETNEDSATRDDAAGTAEDERSERSQDRDGRRAGCNGSDGRHARGTGVERGGAFAQA